MNNASRPRRTARGLTALALAAAALFSSAGISGAEVPTVTTADGAQISPAADPTTEAKGPVKGKAKGPVKGKAKGPVKGKAKDAAVPDLSYDESALPKSLRQLAGEQWYESGTQAGTTMNCLNGYLEPLGMSWTGWYGELGKTPTTNQAQYYTKIGWGVSGFPCGGGAYVHIEEFLPPGSQLAISQQNPVMCWYEGLDADDQMVRISAAEGCPQQPKQGVQGGLSFDPNTKDAAWPSASGTFFEIWVPIKSNQPLSGINGNPCNSCVQAGVWMIDGVNSPWSYPKIGVNVVGNGQTNPAVSYPAPSIRNTACCTAGPQSNQAKGELVAWIFTQGTPGATQFQVDEDSGAPYEYTFDSQITQTHINTFGPDIEQWIELYFDPDTRYYWRMCFTPQGGSQKCGAEQTFEVPSPPDSTPPQTTIDSKPKATSASRTASFTFSSSVFGSTFRCRLDGAAWQGCMNPTYSDLAEGAHNLQVKAVGPTGVEDATPASFDWTIAIPPKTEITKGPPTKTRKTVATFEFTADEPTSKFQCKLDKGKWKVCSSGVTYKKLSRAKHTFSVKATDLLGATDASPATRTWTVKR